MSSSGGRTARSVVRAMAIGRIAIGATLLTAPKPAGAGWIGSDIAGSPGGSVLLRTTAIRDLVLGVAALRESDPGRAAHLQLGLAAVDATDLLVTLAARRALPPRAPVFVGAIAGSAVVAELWAARALASDLALASKFRVPHALRQSTHLRSGRSRWRRLPVVPA